jgi:hypothetical protein
MNNPLESARPAERRDQITAFATDIAYGALHGEWPARIKVNANGFWMNFKYRSKSTLSPNQIRFQEKWKSGNRPTFSLLASFGYLKLIDKRKRLGKGSEASVVDYFFFLTPNAFDLLDKPPTLPSIFISYSTKESSAFALLIEARLRILGIDDTFIDKSISSGEEWEKRLLDQIRLCRNFICLVGPTTFESTWVKREINWAEAVGATIISIWDSGAQMGDDCPDTLRKRQAIVVTADNAKSYEAAANKILNTLGYRSY